MTSIGQTSERKVNITAKIPQTGHDRKQAERYVELLTGSADTAMAWRCFTDIKGQNPQPKNFRGTVSEVWSKLVRLNGQGYGIFATYNELDGEGRSAENVVKIRAVAVDFDQKVLKEAHHTLPKSFPLPPTFCVHTSNDSEGDPNVHPYWVSRSETGFKLGPFGLAVGHIIAKYKSDKAVCDTPRVLRVPGLYHQKSGPFLVKLVNMFQSDPDIRYTDKDMTSRFPPVETESKGKKTRKTKTRTTNNSLYSQMQKLMNDSLPTATLGSRIREVVEAQGPAPEPGEDNKRWTDTLMAVTHLSGGSDWGRDLCHDYSSSAENGYQPEEVDDKFEYFTGRDAEVQVGLQRLVEYARTEQGDDWTPSFWNDKTRADDATRATKKTGTLVWPEISQRTGRPDPKSLSNLRVWIQHRKLDFWFDAFERRVRVSTDGGVPVVFDEGHSLVLWHQAVDDGLRVERGWMMDILNGEARKDKRNPVTDELQTLENSWDGVERIKEMAVRFGCDDSDSEYHRAVFRATMIGIVRRARQPGCQLFGFPIWEGLSKSGGEGKSSACKILAGAVERFTDNLHIGSDAKQVIELTRGVSIVEYAELSGMSKKAFVAINSDITRTVDEARAAYARTTESVARAFFPIGTTNADDYLRNEGGLRRFWSMRVRQIEIDWLRKYRSQLMGEAATIETTGELHNIPESLWAVAAEAREQRLQQNPIALSIEDIISDLALGENDAAFIPLGELSKALQSSGVRPQNGGPAAIRSKMEDMGFVSKTLRKAANNQKRGYLKGEAKSAQWYIANSLGIGAALRKDHAATPTPKPKPQFGGLLAKAMQRQLADDPSPYETAIKEAIREHDFTWPEARTYLKAEGYKRFADGEGGPIFWDKPEEV